MSRLSKFSLDFSTLQPRLPVPNQAIHRPVRPLFRQNSATRLLQKITTRRGHWLNSQKADKAGRGAVSRVIVKKFEMSTLGDVSPEIQPRNRCAHIIQKKSAHMEKYIESPRSLKGQKQPNPLENWSRFQKIPV